MKYSLFILLAVIGLSSCTTSKGIIVKKSDSHRAVIHPQKPISYSKPIQINDLSENIKEPSNYKNVSDMAFHVVDYAQKFSGVKYKYGGTTAAGMDCSGLVFESFRAFDVILPRSSRDMATQGEKINLKDTQEGDLLFFKTFSNKKDITHVGLVVTSENGDIQFIHSTTQAGVITSKLSEKYWNQAFVEARRIL